MRKFFKGISLIILALHLVLLISYLLYGVIDMWMDELANSGDFLEGLFNGLLLLLLLIPALIFVIPSAIYRDIYLEMGIGLYSFYLIIISSVIWLICEYIFFLNNKKQKEEIKKKEEIRKKNEQRRKAKTEAKIKEQKLEEEKRSKEMERRNNILQSTMKFYTETALEVNKTGSIPLIKELEIYYDYLNSENLKNILYNENWDVIQDIIRSIMDDLKKLKELANKYQTESETETYPEETDEEKAYRVLNIPPAATNEQIKSQYRNLSKLWHIDKHLTDDDKMIKDINWAYGFLKKNRNFT